MGVELIGDGICAFGFLLVPILYGVIGREGMSGLPTVATALAGILLAYRLGASLGGAFWMYLRGVIFFLLTNLAVILFNVYKSNGVEYLHMFIGGSFVSSTVPMALCWWYVPPPSKIDEAQTEAVKDTELAAETQ